MAVYYSNFPVDLPGIDDAPGLNPNAQDAAAPERSGTTLGVIREAYAQDNRPWVIGFSGGKDSTCTLQLVWQALKELPKSKRAKPIHVISSNTLVKLPPLSRISKIQSTRLSELEDATD